MRDESTVARLASWFDSITMLIEAVSNWKHMAGGYGSQTHGTNWRYHIGLKHMEAARRRYPSQCSRQWGKRVWAISGCVVLCCVVKRHFRFIIRRRPWLKTSPHESNHIPAFRDVMYCRNRGPGPGIHRWFACTLFTTVAEHQSRIPTTKCVPSLKPLPVDCPGTRSISANRCMKGERSYIIKTRCSGV